MKSVNFAVLVSGRGSNMTALADALSKAAGVPARIACVLSDAADAPALQLAGSRGIEAAYISPGARYRTRLTEEAEQEYVRFLQERHIDYVLLAGFMRMLKSGFLQAFPGRVINIHPSLLPAYPGLDTHERVLAAGERETGCTVHYVDEGMDSGAIIAQVRVPVEPEDSPDILAARVLGCEHRLYARVVQELASTGSIAEMGRVYTMDEIFSYTG